MFIVEYHITTTPERLFRLRLCFMLVYDICGNPLFMGYTDEELDDLEDRYGLEFETWLEEIQSAPYD